MKTTSEVIVLTYEQLAAMLKDCIRCACDTGAGDPPVGYEELTPEQVKVADECWHKGMDDLESAVLNWAFDELATARAETPAEARAVDAAVQNFGPQ